MVLFVGSGDQPEAAISSRRRLRIRRRSRSLLMLGAMTALKTVYAQSDPYLQWLRNVGVAATVRAGPLKQQLIREALGLGAVARA